MAKSVFEVNGKQFPTMLAVAKELGRSRVYRSDFERFGITEIDESEIKDIEATTDEEPKATEASEQPQEDTTNQEQSNSEHLNEHELEALRGELNMETIYDWAYGVKHMTSKEIRDVLVGRLNYDSEKVPSTLNKGTRMHLVRMFRESLYPGVDRPKVGAKAFRKYNLDELKELYERAGFSGGIVGETEKGQRRSILKVFRENGIHNPNEIN